MKATEYIAKLQALVEEHGDLEVQTYGCGGRCDATEPDARFIKLLTKRESRPEFWAKWDGEERKGDKVFLV